MKFLSDGNLDLTPLTNEHVSQEYLSWLNGEKERRWRGPKAFPSTQSDIYVYIGSARGHDRLILAIVGEKKHVGNIALYPIDWVHRTAEVSILIGAEHQRKRYGFRAIGLIAKHAFESMGLYRLWAESPNPAFGKLMERLGWSHEGTKREAFLLDGQRADVHCWGMLARDFIYFRPQAREGIQGVVPKNPLEAGFRKIESGQFTQGKGRADEWSIGRKQDATWGLLNQTG